MKLWRHRAKQESEVFSAENASAAIKRYQCLRRIDIRAASVILFFECVFNWFPGLYSWDAITDCLVAEWALKSKGSDPSFHLNK